MIVWLLAIAILLLTIDVTSHRDDGRYIDNSQSSIAKKADRLPLKRVTHKKHFTPPLSILPPIY